MTHGPSPKTLRGALQLSAASSVLLLAACGGGGGGASGILPTATTPTTSAALTSAAAPTPLTSNSTTPLSPAQQCDGLQAATVAAGSITLPTTGASVTSATLKPAAGTGATAVGEYCLVKGAINPVDRSAPSIQFQVNLPTDWNGKAFQQTGGGYDGSVVTGTGNVPGASGNAIPLARGYVTFGSDSGHVGGDGSFAVNDEALENYFGDQLKKTRDVAVELIKQRYQKQPTRTYIAGGSGGGREALYGADRWPDVYDGVIAYYPAWSLTAMILNYGRISKALAAPGAWPNPAKQALLAPAVIAACDSVDGVVDGVVSNSAACNFDPVVLRCPGGADTGDTCLSDAQLAGVRSFAEGLTLPYALARGVTKFPAFNVFTAGVHIEGTAGGSAAPANPSTNSMPFSTYIFEPMAKYWVMQDSNFDPFLFSVSSPAFVPQRLNYISSRMDVRPDLGAFKNKGGKVLMVTGQADSFIPSASSVDFYNALQTSMGAAALQSFLKFYYVPGYDHGFGAQFNLSWDSVTALEQWVEKDTAPSAQVARDANASANGRTRPLCDYPAWPKYNGAGDQASASSFACIR